MSFHSIVPASAAPRLSVMAELFKGKTLYKKDDSPVDGSTLAGKVVGVYFSAHWCPPCRNFTPQLKSFHAAVRDDFEVVFVSSDSSQANLKKYMDEMHGDWLYVKHGDPLKKELNKKYDVDGIPTLLIIKPNGDIITKNGHGACKSAVDRHATVAKWKAAMSWLTPDKSSSSRSASPAPRSPAPRSSASRKGNTIEDIKKFAKKNPAPTFSVLAFLLALIATRNPFIAIVAGGGTFAAVTHAGKKKAHKKRA